MMPDFTLIEGKAWHCGAIVRRLRHGHLEQLYRAGIDIHRELRVSFDSSSYRRTWLIDGKIAGMGGIIGSDISASGFVWIAVTEAARKYPLQIIRTVRGELDQILALKHQLTCIVLPYDEPACRFAAFMGFRVAASQVDYQGYSRTGRRHLTRFLRDEPELRVPFGSGFCVPMACSRDMEKL